MNLVTDGPKDPPETPEQLRLRLLRCPKVKAALAKVARSHGVRGFDVEEVVAEALAAYSVAKKVPGVEDEARRFINGIGKNKALDFMEAKKERAAASLDAMGERAARVDARLEQRASIQAVAEKGAAKFGRKWDWFLQSKVEGKTSKEIGAEHGVTDSHVRDELSVVDRWFTSAWGKGGIGSALALVLAVGLGWWITHRKPDDSQWPTYHPSYASVHEPVQKMDAESLRERARIACDEGAWEACEHDLAAARAMDPAGQTVDLEVLEKQAHDGAMRYDAEDVLRMNSKTGH